MPGPVQHVPSAAFRPGSSSSWMIKFCHLLRTFWAKECCDVWQFGPWHTPWSGLGGQSKNSEFLQPQAVLAGLMGLQNSDMAFPEILIRDGQTRGKKIRNPFALVVGLNKVQLTFFLPPPSYFSLQCRLHSSRFQQDWGCRAAGGL